MKMGAFVLGYHGCDRSVGEALLAGRETFVGSENEDDLLHRNLDCAVINHVHETREGKGLESFETVRGAFSEGEELYPGAGIKAQTHIQIAVTNSANIKGIFRIPSR